MAEARKAMDEKAQLKTIQDRIRDLTPKVPSQYQYLLESRRNPRQGLLWDPRTLDAEITQRVQTEPPT